MNLLRLKEEYYPIFWVKEFLSDDEIEQIKKYVKNIKEENAKIGENYGEESKPFKADSHIKDFGKGIVPKVRVTNVKWISLNKDTNWLFKKIIKKILYVNQHNFDMQLRWMENLQFLEYTGEKKGFYCIHDDAGDKRSALNYVDIRKLSFTIQLSNEEDYEGGDLIFHLNDEEKMAPKEKGTIIFFESDMLHEVKPVTKGVRHSLVSWVQGCNLR